MKNRKGFTLIELLAVIVILAIIALIAVPQVLKILNQARVSAAEDSTYGIYNATQDYISKTMLLNGGDFPNEDLIFTCDPSSCKLDNYDVLSNEYNLEETIDYKGKKATDGKIKIINGGKDIVIENLKISEFNCKYSNDKAHCGTKGNLYTKVHIGDYITYDPTLGVSDSNLLNYTSPMGEFKVKDSNGTYLVDGSSDSNVESYNNAWNMLDENGKFVLDGYIVERDVSGNGYGNESFQAKSNDNLWRVLSIDDSTGVVRIVPDKEIRTVDNFGFALKGVRGYKNGVTELNNISSIFGHGVGADGAKNITIDEVNNLTGFNPAIDAQSNFRYGKLVTTDGTGNRKWRNNAYVYDGRNFPGKNTDETAKIYEMLFEKNNSSRSYWISSSILFHLNDLFRKSLEMNMCTMKTRSVSCTRATVFTDLDETASTLWSVNSSGGDYGTAIVSSVKPVVSLSFDVNSKSGDGSKNSPWQFQ